MKALTRQLQSMLTRQPYEKSKHFSSEGVLEFNNGCSVTYIASEHKLRLNVNAINSDIALPAPLNNLNLSLSTGVLINYETLVVNLVSMDAVDNNCVITYNIKNASTLVERFTGHNAVVLIDDKYTSNEKLDVAIVYLEGGYTPPEDNTSPPIISCIPTAVYFTVINPETPK